MEEVKITSEGRGISASGTEKNEEKGILERNRMAALRKRLFRTSDVRWEKVYVIKAQIARGEYESEEKLEIAVERIIEELAGRW